MIFTLPCRVERLDGGCGDDGSGYENTHADLRVEEIALLRVDAIGFGGLCTGEIVMRSGFRTTLRAKWEDWEDLRKLLYTR